jgi:alginate O-acetyltransferase complex protein AlgJ
MADPNATAGPTPTEALTAVGAGPARTAVNAGPSASGATAPAVRAAPGRAGTTETGGAPDEHASRRLSAHLPPPSPTRRWRQLDRLVVVVFCLGLIVPVLLSAAGLRPAAIENRPLLTAPPVSLESLLDPTWYASVDRFLTDNVPVRPFAVRLRGEANWRFGGTGNPAVVRGIGTWLFTRDEIAARCELTATDIAAGLDRANAAFAAAGQGFRFVVAPDKHAIHPEKLDPGMAYGSPCTDRQRDAMRAELGRRPAFAVDGWAALLAQRSARPDGPPLYYAQDSHWTPSGALASIRELIRSLGPDLWRDDDVVEGKPKRVAMELARQMGLSRAETVASPRVRPSVDIVRTPIEVPVETNNARAIYRITASGDRPLVPGRTAIVYDSFFGLYMSAVAPFFEETVWIHQGDLLNHPEIAQLVGPFDRVILERVERGLYFTRIDELLRPLVRAGG